MNRFIQKNKFILVLLTIVICLSCAYGLTVKLDPTVNAAPARTSANDYSWATMSQAAAQWLGQTASPEGNHGGGVSAPDAKTAFVGNFLGYLGVSDDSFYTVASLESANTVSYSYTTLAKLNTALDKRSGADWSSSAKTYAGFGYALTASGIDEPVIIGQTADDKRNIIGPVVLIIFLLCMALPQFFQMVLTFLSVANPFKLFIGANSVLRSIVPTIDAGPGFDNQNTAVTTAMGNALNTLADAITGLYNQLYSLSFFAIVPILIALALFSWLVLRKSASSVFKNLAIKITFIGLGVPLMLACYTAAIDSVKDFMINTSMGAPISVITSTFCDYGDWLLGDQNDSLSYMRLPQGVNLKVDVSEGTYKYLDSSTSDRRIVQLINGYVDDNLRSSALLSGVNDATSIASDDLKLVKSVRGYSSSDRTTAVINLLQRYTKGEYVTAGNFATKFNTKYAGSANRELYMKVFNMSNLWQCFEPELAVAYKYEKSDGDAFSIDISDSDAKRFAEERLQSSGILGTNYQQNPFESSFDSSFSEGNYSGTALQADAGNAKYGKSSLSPMSAYNLLSSTFSDTAITVYSTAETSTNQVQLAHYAVSLAGQGYMELAYVFDACAIMCCLMVLGYGYGFALLFACFKGLIQMFPKVLTGMIGSMRGIAGSLALVAALIVEIIGTCIMYSLGSMFIGGVYELIEVPLATILTNIAGLPNQAAALVTVVASAVIIIKLTGLLLKYRTAVVKSVSETATGFINKFMETNVVAPNLESGMSAGSLASIGLGMAMVGASTPAGSKLADRASDLTDKVANADADKVASAAMSGASLTGAHGEKYASAADAEKAKNEANMHEASSSLSASDTGGHYSNGNPSGVGTLADESDSSVKTTDDVAADYVNDNGADFEKEIGYSSDSEGVDNSNKLADKKKAGSDSDNTDEDDGFQGYTGRTERGNGSVEEWKNGRLVAKWDPDGNKIVDNSTQEITGTQTTDITSEEQGEADNKSAGNKSSKNIADNSSESQTGSKFVITDSDGHQQEVSIVNAKTGAAYTQADKDAGANYDVVDSSGKSIYGNLEGGMSANTIGMSNGQPTVMVAPGSGGTNAYGGGGMYTVSQAPVPTMEAPAASGSAGSQNVTQNVNQTNVTNTTANTSNMTTENTTQNMNTQQFANVSGGNAGSVQSAPSQGQTTIVHDNAGSSPVNVNVAGAGVSGPAQVHVDFPGSGGSNAGGSAPVSSTVTEHVTNTVTNQTTESVIYSQGGSQGFSSGNQQNNTYVTSNTTVNQDVSNNVQNNVNNQSNTTVNSSDNSSGVSLGFGSLGSGSHGGNGHRK